MRWNQSSNTFGKVARIAAIPFIVTGTFWLMLNALWAIIPIDLGGVIALAILATLCASLPMPTELLMRPSLGWVLKAVVFIGAFLANYAFIGFKIVPGKS